MNLRRDRTSSRKLASVVAVAGLFLTVGGCGGGDGGSDEKRVSGQSSASSPDTNTANESEEVQSQAPVEQVMSTVKGGGLTLIVTSAERGQGGFVTVQGKVQNGSGKPWSAGEWRGDESELAKNGGSIAGASLVDNAGKKKYFVLRDTEGRCLCTRFTGGIMSGDTTEWFAQFPSPPEGTTKVDFQVGSMPPAAIEISEGE
ncbi:hypothetical protein ACFWPV_11085 [Streptomyces uncialis]|uniref:hypothetical protein n=1 Tax=Streptomyces uncialis TaxID=1048205 RepID=UPI00364F4015